MLAVPSLGQQTLDNPVEQVQPYEVDSGVQLNVPSETAVIYETTVQIEDAFWLRIYFGDVELADGSFIRMTSLWDDEVQELDRTELAMWGNASAYFNGESVRVELIAAAGTTNNRLRIQELGLQLADKRTGAGGSGQCGICGGSDDRVPSDEEWTSRLFPAGCTASVIGEDSCMVSAGHCMGGSMVVQFNVPPSTSGCNPVNPPIADQFPIMTLFDFDNNGPGDDWAVMKAGNNNLGQTPYERYGVLRPVATAVAPPGALVELTGYGVDLTCVRTLTQQFADGTICQTFSNAYTFAVDLRGGNSGSALMRNDEVIGIATHCPCCNTATRITNGDVAAVIADNCIPPEEVTTTLPFFDDFEEVLLRPEFWTGVDGADVWITGINEPSGQISMRLDATNPEGGGDEARSAVMDTRTTPDLKLTYWYQQTGEEDSPESGDDLLVEYRDAADVWVEVNRHLGSGPDMTEYEFVSIVLPAAAQHTTFRLRFNALSSETGQVDTHFVDDVCVGGEADCPDQATCPWDCEPEPDGIVGITDFLHLLATWAQVGTSCDFDGDGVAVTDFLALLANWGACP